MELAKKLVKEQGEVDPTLELSKFRGPTLELLKAYNEEGITINEAELEENKEKIVETLSNYKIGIADIKATIGPHGYAYMKSFPLRESGFQKSKTSKTISPVLICLRHSNHCAYPWKRNHWD